MLNPSWHDLRGIVPLSLVTGGWLRTGQGLNKKFCWQSTKHTTTLVMCHFKILESGSYNMPQSMWSRNGQRCKILICIFFQESSSKQLSVLEAFSSMKTQNNHKKQNDSDHHQTSEISRTHLDGPVPSVGLVYSKGSEQMS